MAFDSELPELPGNQRRNVEIAFPVIDKKHDRIEMAVFSGHDTYAGSIH
jgi:hypothetical protein